MNAISDRLLSWYAQNARSLPWRGLNNAYATWVSEIMLQQTRVETVIPYFERWMERFPTMAAVAAASEQEVLAVWEGLGYYSRARSLHAAAQMVLSRYDGKLPCDLAELQKLPGIGRYTAGAIASIACGADAPALDGNIRRVLARLFNMEEPARSPLGVRTLWQLAEQTLPAGRAGDYNQALMDLGASLCTPLKPRCLLCPLADVCQARALGVQEQRPVLARRVAIPHYVVTAAVIWREGKVLIAKRPAKGLLGSLWEFPGGKQEPGESLSECLQREIREELGVEVAVGAQLGLYHHAYTHFKVSLHAFVCGLATLEEPQLLQHADLQWVLPAELGNYPMGKIDRTISGELTRG